MDSLHAIGFYVSAALAVGGGLAVAFLPERGARGLGLAIAGLGQAGIYASLSAAFAGVVALLCYAGCALLIAGLQYRAVQSTVRDIWRQLGAVAAAGLLALLGYATFRGAFAHTTFNEGAIGATGVGRLLFAHDALTTEALAALVLVALVGATVAWRARDRGR